MRTRKELIPFTLEELQRMAKDEGIDILGRNKMGLISELLIKDKSPKPIIEEASLEEIPDPVYTDRGGKQIFREETVNCRVGGKWFPGVISRFKKIEDDDYAFVILEGAEKTKMFHTIDLEKISKPKGTKTAKDINDFEKVSVIVPEVSEPEAVEVPEVITHIKVVTHIEPQVKPEKVKSEPEVKKEKVLHTKILPKFNELGFRVTKHDNELMGLDLCGIKYHDMVEFKVSELSRKNPGKVLTGIVDSLFWDPIAKRPYFIIKVAEDTHIYCKSIDKVKLV